MMWVGSLEGNEKFRRIVVVVVVVVAVDFVVAVALPLLGPHKAVAVEPAERPARVKHKDVRVFLQDREVL